MRNPPGSAHAHPMIWDRVMECVCGAEVWAIMLCTSLESSERAFLAWGVSVGMFRLDPAIVEVMWTGSCRD